jgi:curved DNA-binding protein
MEDFFGGGGNFSDFFSTLFGGAGPGAGRGRAGRAGGMGFKGQDYNAELYLTLQEAFEGTKKTVGIDGRNLRINIHPGVEDGQTIRLKGSGAPGMQGGENGDLYITLRIHPDSMYTRKGNDLFIDAPVSLYKAILGGEAVIDTLSGQVKIKIKPETKNGTTLRLKGKGFPAYRQEGVSGDLYIKISLEIPESLTEKEKDLFRQLASLRNEL